MTTNKNLVSEVMVNDEFALHLYVEDQDDWTVWVDTEVSEMDGLCIGTGVTRQMAVDNALEKLALLLANVLKLK